MRKRSAALRDVDPSARAVALEALDGTLRRRRALDATMETGAGWATLPTRDRAFAYTLVATTLRRLGQIDALIATALRQPLPERAHVARSLLRLGVCQLVMLKTPAHAAVDTTVDLARRYRQGRYLGLINAVLRRLARDGAAILASQDAARLNTPTWLWQAWTGVYGAERCRRIAQAHLNEPPLDLTVKTDAAEVAARLGGTVLPTGTVRLGGAGSPTSLPGFAGGEYWVQDAAAALPMRMLGDVGGRRIIDLCAAPGGKTAQLAAAGAMVTAIDRAPERARRLCTNLSRLGLSAEVVVADALAWRPAERADAVLLDAPCSATGTIRRHPDVAWIKCREDVVSVAAVQRQLLAAAADMVKPGGLIVYCVCSLQSEEGADQIEALGREAGFLERVPLDATDVPGLEEAVTEDGDLRTFPFMLDTTGGMDGFYAARLRNRRSS